VLTTTRLASQLETIALIHNKVHPYGYDDVPDEHPIPMKLPKLQHLTLAPGIRFVSGFRIQAPQLTSLHISLNNKLDTWTDLVSYGTFFPELFATLHEDTISTEFSDWRTNWRGRRHEIPLKFLMMLIAPIFERDLKLTKFTLRHLNLLDNEAYELRALKAFLVASSSRV
jgi:hypothetical protein